MLGTFSGGGLGFGVAFTLYDNFTRTANDIERSLDRLSLTTSAVSRRIDNSINQMAMGAGMLAAGLAAALPIGLGVQIAGEFEQAKIGLETLLKSKEAAEEMFTNIKKDAATSSFGVESLLMVNRALVATGLDAENARKDTMNLANAIAAVGGSNDHLARMAINMQQIRNLGKANGIDIKQFGYAGINIYKLLEETTGIHIDQLKEMDITYEQIATALEHAAAAGGMYEGALYKQSLSIFGRVEQLMDRIKYAGAAIGEAIMPVLRPMLTMLTDFFAAIADFAETPLGTRTFQVVAAMTALLLVTGSLLVVTGFMRFSAFKLAQAFGTQTRALILQTIVQRGTIAGYKAMAAAAWASLGPYLAIAAAIGALVGIFYGLNKMLNSTSVATRNWAYFFLIALGPIGWLIGGIMAIIQGLRDFDAYTKGTIKNLTGLAGFFQDLGGIIRGVQMIFSTWGIAGGNTFALTKDLQAQLESLGILDTVIAVGTWIARFKALAEGFWEGLVMVWEDMKRSFNELRIMLQPFVGDFENLGIVIDKNLTPLEKWRKYGKWIGIVFAATIASIVVLFMLLGAVATVILIGIAAVFALPIALAYGLYKAVMWIASGLEAVLDWCDRVNASFMELYNIVDASGNELDAAMLSWIENAASVGYDFGRDLILGMIEGMKSIGSSVVDWFKNGPIGNALKGKVYYDVPKSTWGGSENEEVSVNTSRRSLGRATRGMEDIAKTKALPFQSQSNFNGTGPTVDKGNQAPIIVQNILDGRVISESVLDVMALQEARR